MGGCQQSDTLSSFVTDQPVSFMQSQALCLLGDDLPKFTRSLADDFQRHAGSSLIFQRCHAEIVKHARTHSPLDTHTHGLPLNSPEEVQVQKKAYDF